MDKGYLAKLNVEILTLKHPRKQFNTYNDEIEYLGENWKVVTASSLT